MLFFNKTLDRVYLILILISIGYAQTEVGGIININTTWNTSGSPYVVTSNLAVMNATLNIGPGVEIKFNSGLNLNILTNAILIVEGSDQDTITFSGNGPGISWQGIRFAPDAIYSTVQNDSIYVGGSIFLYTKFLNVSAPNLDVTEGGVFTLEGGDGLYFRNCYFKNNTSPRAACYSGNSGVFIDCKFIENIATSHSNGGTLSISNNAYLLRSLFLQNSSEGSGSAGYFGSAHVIIDDCVFNNNISNRGGTISTSYGELRVSRSSFENNTGSNAGAISGGPNGEIYILNSKFTTNEAITGSGALTFGNMSSLYIANNVFSENISGGDYSAACNLHSGGNSLVEGNLFSRNISQGYASAIQFDSHATFPSLLRLTNNYFYGNISAQPETAVFYGLGTIDNNVFFDNSSLYDIKFILGSTGTYDVSNNYWSTKDSVEITNNHIYDFYDDPTFNTAIAEFTPFLLGLPESNLFKPSVIHSLGLKNDAISSG